MNDYFFSRVQKYSVLAVKYSFFLFNLALLAGLSVKTVNLWIADPFDFADTLAAFPEEPEFINKNAAENQFWAVLILETVLFLIGGFLCYEQLIKQKTFRRSIVAPIAVVFLWTAGESIHLFIPATEKAHQINSCKAMEISWDIKNHKCRLMDLELKRFETLKKRMKKKKTVSSSSPAITAQNKNNDVVSQKEPQPEKERLSPTKTAKPAEKTAPVITKKITEEKPDAKQKEKTETATQKSPAADTKKEIVLTDTRKNIKKKEKTTSERSLKDQIVSKKENTIKTSVSSKEHIVPEKENVKSEPEPISPPKILPISLQRKPSTPLPPIGDPTTPIVQGLTK